MANWRTLIPSNDRRYMVKGSEIEVTYPAGYRSRFAVYAVRCYKVDSNDNKRYSDLYYRVRDADVRAGKRPPVVVACDTFDEALAWIARHND